MAERHEHEHRDAKRGDPSSHGETHVSHRSQLIRRLVGLLETDLPCRTVNARKIRPSQGSSPHTRSRDVVTGRINAHALGRPAKPHAAHAMLNEETVQR
jgi:hypothetical protein